MSVPFRKTLLQGGGSIERRTFLRCAVSTSGVALLGSLSGCASPKAIGLNLKLRFTTNCDGVELRHSGVWRMDWIQRTSFPNPGDMVVEEVSGDAIPIVLPNGQSVFAVLAWGQGEVPPTRLFPWEVTRLLATGYQVDMNWLGGDCPGLRTLAEEAPTAPIDAPPAFWPAFAAFWDPMVPGTAHQVDPGNLSRLAGAPCKIEQVTVQVVEEAVDRRIEQSLPWLKDRHAVEGLLSESGDMDLRPKHFSK